MIVSVAPGTRRRARPPHFSHMLGDLARLSCSRQGRAPSATGTRLQLNLLSFISLWAIGKALHYFRMLNGRQRPALKSSLYQRCIVVTMVA